jgi:tetratricopeptide (TPR) repeat protein/class 3 adenylate cyclase
MKHSGDGLPAPSDTPERPATQPLSEQASAALDPAGSTKLEMAYVLFMDIVAYSKLPTDEQHRLLARLQEAVRGTSTFSKAQARNQLIRLPTGDGMALVFFGRPEWPAQCALELGQVLRSSPEIELRMGIHAGPIYRIQDINAALNVAGGGVNIAQRVMDCGDAGHILVSSAIANVLDQVSGWKQKLHDLGEAEVKHGVRVHLFNLCTTEAGNRARPQKLCSASRRARLMPLAAVVAVAIASIGAYLYLHGRRFHPLTEQDTLLLADFTNKTGDPLFDDALKQALTVALRQSPFLNVLSDSRVAATLKLMERPPGTAVTGEVAREVCQRAGSKAYVASSITAMGSQYALWLKAVNCASGDNLAQEQATASGKEKVLDALGQAAARLRAELGESLASVEKFDTPLAQATTSSLEALRAYSMATKVEREQGAAASLPFAQRAVELDPSFAAAHAALGLMYSNLGQPARAREYLTKAFALRERASQREKLSITAFYYDLVTGELEKGAQAYQEWIENYPRDLTAYVDLAVDRQQLGDYASCVELNRHAFRLDPNVVFTYGNLGECLMSLGALDESRKTFEKALSRKLDDHTLHGGLYGLAFLAGDTEGMARQAAWFGDKPDLQHEILSGEADTEAYGGHLGRARELTRRAVDSAMRAANREAAAACRLDAALTEATFGNTARARQETEAALKLAPDSRDIEAQAALADAWASDEVGARKLAADLRKRFPLATLVNGYWLPTVEAQMKLAENDPDGALDLLQAVPSPLELGQPVSLGTCLHPVYARGEAYLAAGQGSAAAGEFRKILDHRGIVVNCPTGALARLGLGRAYALQAGIDVGAGLAPSRAHRGTPLQADALAKVRAAYQDFFTLWKDADPDISILKQAKAEYAKLQ